MNQFLSLSFVVALVLMTNISMSAQNNEQNIRTKRTKTTTTTTTIANSSNVDEKSSFTLINGQMETHNFGNNIKVGHPVEHTFQFRNNGAKSMHITNVSSSCGCTTPEWSDKPIAPGKTGSVKVLYNSAAIGKFHKSVTLTFHDKSTKTLWIQGEVVK